MSNQTKGPFSLVGLEVEDWAKAEDTRPEPIAKSSDRFEFILALFLI
jgi:hypothetical protein